MTDDDIHEAILRHGAKAVHDAACAAMSGNRAALHRLGLQSSSVAADHHVMTIAYKAMSAVDQAADLADVTITLAKL